MCVVVYIRYDSSSEKLFFNPSALALSQFYVLVAYALNPLTIASCAAMSTAVFHNLILAIFLLCLLNGELLKCCIFFVLFILRLLYLFYLDHFDHFSLGFYAVLFTTCEICKKNYHISILTAEC